VRDSRVSMIYEGTNEIQAIDLLIRKVLPDGGLGVRAFLQSLCGRMPPNGHEQTRQMIEDACELTHALVSASKSDVALPYWVADDYLRIVALALLAWAWLQIEATTDQSTPAVASPRWTEPGQALRHWILPEFAMRVGIVKARLTT
jgi:hypothetical protein